jgi:hypothetical protein
VSRLLQQQFSYLKNPLFRCGAIAPSLAFSYQGAKRQSTRTVQAYASQTRRAKALRPQSWRGSHERIRPSPGGAPGNGTLFPCGAVHARGRRSMPAGGPCRSPHAGGSLLFRTAPRRSAAAKVRRHHHRRALVPAPEAIAHPRGHAPCPFPQPGFVPSPPSPEVRSTTPSAPRFPPAGDPRPCGQKRRPRT